MSLSKIKKGDVVKVLTGKDRGKTGKVLTVIPEKGRITVEKVNIIKKHKRPDQKSKGGIVEKEGSINISNVGLFCNKCKKAVRAQNKTLEDGKKLRICCKCKEVI